MFDLMTLPFAEDALEPHISATTLRLHHDRHHRKYVETLNGLVAGTALEHMLLDAIILTTAGKPEMQAIFNNAGQVWNHDFFWASMAASPAEPNTKVRSWIDRDFGGLDDFKKQFKDAAVGRFGSGWAWLVIAPDVKLKVVSTSNAETPITGDLWPLLACDVWEHAYYIDYQNRRADFVQAFLDHLVNWEFVSARLQTEAPQVETRARA